MGILNITPDSFSDGGIYPTSRAAADQALKMEEAGADIIDIGGESTRPGAKPVSAEQQKLRVVPVIKAIREVSSVPISIDTTFPEVARAAVKAGAGMINSVSGLETPGMLELAVSLELPVVLMHMKGVPETMQEKPFYRDAAGEITDYLVSRVEALVKLGMPRELILVDPGIGFGKRLEDNLELIRSLRWIGTVTGCRVLLGHSRKSFLGSITGIQKPDLRDSVTHVVTVLAEGADVVRVHDVQGTVAAFKVAEAVRGGL
ncbi:dihydropteroate synthase [Candidatus Fermentibacteria bacterium]|nr:MAG: dihydropteroate synthase [Candidatus Fermentibacteria bacterium]